MQNRSLRTALVAGIALSFSLTGCSVATNRSLESGHQPVVSHASYSFDLNTGPGGLSSPEASRLADWFEAMNLRYGDKITIDDPLASEATRTAISTVAGGFGIMISDAPAPVSGGLSAGTARVVLTRASATVPGCPDWSAKSDTNLLNGSSSNYGCATNSNLAAMVADPDHLLHGASGASVSSSLTTAKAIDAFHTAPPTGQASLKTDATSKDK